MTSTTAGARPSEGGAPLRMPRGAVLIRALAIVNLLTIVMSVVAFATGWQYGTWLFPQAAVFFPSAWAEIVPRGAVWLVFAGIAAIVAGVGALRAPAGHRGYAVFRSLTIFGAVVAVVMAALVVAASFITL